MSSTKDRFIRLRGLVFPLTLCAFLFHCAEEGEDDGTGSGSSTDSAATASGPGGDAGCDAACDHLINDCGFEMDANGNPLDMQSCVSQCEGGDFGDDPDCVANAECTLEGLLGCAEGGSASGPSGSGSDSNGSDTSPDTTTTTTTTGNDNCGDPGDACSEAMPCCIEGSQVGICFNSVCCLGEGSDCSADGFSCCEGYACESVEGGASTCVAL